MGLDISSPFIRKHKKKLLCSSGLALDLPCGTGRNIGVLESLGYTVTSADISLESFSPESTPIRSPSVPMHVDGYIYHETFDRRFDLVAVIHPPHHSMLDILVKYVRIGGLIVFESFGAQGENWKLLPTVGEIERQLTAMFDLIVYDETACRQSPSNVTVKLIGQRRAD